MFIFTLTYLKPLNEVDNYLQQHIDYLENHYQSGHFIVSGRKVPRTGGMILCHAESKEQAISIMQKDPFYIHKIVQYDIIKFALSKYLDGFVQYI